MDRNLLILGAGQYGSIVKEIAQTTGVFDKIKFLDDTFGQGTVGNERPIGKLDMYADFLSCFAEAIVAIGNNKVRMDWTHKLQNAGYVIPIIASPRAVISRSAQIEIGCVIEPLACIQPNTVVKQGSLISSGAVIKHNSVVSEYCHIDCNAVVPHNTTVPPCTTIAPGQIAGQ